MISNFKLFLVMCPSYHWQFQTIENPHYDMVWRMHSNCVEYQDFVVIVVQFNLSSLENISAILKI